MPDWITTEEARRLSGYHPEHLRQLIREQKITAQKFGRTWQVSRKSLLNFLKRAQASGDKRHGPHPPQSAD